MFVCVCFCVWVWNWGSEFKSGIDWSGCLCVYVRLCVCVCVCTTRWNCTTRITLYRARVKQVGGERTDSDTVTVLIIRFDFSFLRALYKQVVLQIDSFRSAWQHRLATFRKEDEKEHCRKSEVSCWALYCHAHSETPIRVDYNYCFTCGWRNLGAVAAAVVVAAAVAAVGWWSADYECWWRRAAAGSCGTVVHS